MTVLRWCEAKCEKPRKFIFIVLFLHDVLDSDKALEGFEKVTGSLCPGLSLMFLSQEQLGGGGHYDGAASCITVSAFHQTYGYFKGPADKCFCSHTPLLDTTARRTGLSLDRLCDTGASGTGLHTVRYLTESHNHVIDQHSQTYSIPISRNNFIKYRLYYSGSLFIKQNIYIADKVR